MAIQVSVNIVTAEVSVNAQDIQCEVNFTPAQAEISCCGNGNRLPTDGDPGDVLTWNGTLWEAEPPGASASYQTYPAGQNLSAGRVVIVDNGEARYFQPATNGHSNRAYGITKTSATTGNDVTIQTEGIISDASFSAFSDEALYVGTDGALQTTWPASGIIQKAGVAVGGNKVKIDFSIQILQA